MTDGIFQQLDLIKMIEIKNFRIRITKPEFETINEVNSERTDFFYTEKISESEYVLTFSDIEKVIELDELIKDQLVFKGFDMNYNPNCFGKNCEDLIDKFYEI